MKIVQDMMINLREVGLFVTAVPGNPYTIHVESNREIPCFLWELENWHVSTAGIGKIFLTYMGG
jgi:hypothetical protein